MMVKHAGHTVIVSGLTLLSTFIGLQCLQITSIRSVSLGASISILSSIIVTLVLIPALITSFLGSHILDLCVCSYKDRNEYGPLGIQLMFENLKHYFNKVTENDDDSSDMGLPVESRNEDDEYTSFRDLLGHNLKEDGNYTLDHSTHIISAFSPNVSISENRSEGKMWRNFGSFICHKGRAALILLVVFAVFIPIAMKSVTLQTSLQLEKMLPRGSSSFQTFQSLMKTYGEGSLSTYRVVFSSKKEKRVDTREGFHVLQIVMQVNLYHFLVYQLQCSFSLNLIIVLPSFTVPGRSLRVGISKLYKHSMGKQKIYPDRKS